MVETIFIMAIQKILLTLIIAVDTLVLSGAHSDYAISRVSNDIFNYGYYISDLGSGFSDGVDTLYGINQIQFSDLTISTEVSLINHKINLPNDTLTGTSGDDLIDGKSGNDTIKGLAGNDVLIGGSGHDTIKGGSGNDAIYGDSGDDTISTGAGNDSVWGGSGDDTITSTAGTDTIDAGSGDNTIDVLFPAQFCW